LLDLSAKEEVRDLYLVCIPWAFPKGTPREYVELIGRARVLEWSAPFFRGGLAMVKRWMSRIVGAALILSVLNASAEAAKLFEGETIRAMFWAGSQGRNVIEHMVKPFEEKTGAKVVIEHGRTGDTMAKVRAQKASPQLDIAMFDDVGVLLLGREGLLDTINLSRLPNAQDIHPRAIIEGEKGKVQGIGFFQFATALLYNPQLVPEPPSSWRTLWDPKYKGKVQIPSTRSAISFFVAVAAAKSYGGSEYNMAPAWSALRDLRGNLHSLSTNETLTAEMMKNNELALVANAPFLFKEQIEQGYPLRPAYGLKEGVFGIVSVVAIVKGHPGKDAVIYEFVNQVLDAEAQRKMSIGLWTGPTNRKVKLPPEVSDKVIDSEEEWNNLVLIDLENYSKSRAGWVEEYNKATQ
jgi:putative spermidine/putrescine transport system substrate-binding protein